MPTARAVFRLAAAAQIAGRGRAEARLLLEERRAQRVSFLPILPVDAPDFVLLLVHDDGLEFGSPGPRASRPALALKVNSSEPKLTPAGMRSNEGRESFSASLISKNCAGAKKSRSGWGVCLLRAQADAADAEAPRTGRRCMAEAGDIHVQGHDGLLDRQRPERMEQHLAGRSGLARSVTIGRWPAGSWPIQLPGWPSASSNSGSTSTGSGRGGFSPCDQGPVDADRHIPPQDFERRLGLDVQRPRAGQRAFDPHLEQVGRAALELQLGVELGQELERGELDQHVEADFALDAEAGAAAYSSARAPNWTVLAVRAK